MDIQAFDQVHVQALRRLWFLGDVHGHFDHIGPAVEAAAAAGNTPAWLVFRKRAVIPPLRPTA